MRCIQHVLIYIYVLFRIYVRTYLCIYVVVWSYHHVNLLTTGLRVGRSVLTNFRS